MPMLCDPFSRNDRQIKDGRQRSIKIFDNLIGVQVQFLPLRWRGDALSLR